ncbi:PREDICTED: uncharacterized protein LOC109356182 [Lupinus angustifolius]|uniref:uncharacterized protein LOC109356182 n=1 Tax=Lupinus angustifolius TaxID=3871 RepID=UPI00092FB9F2|nr:PREDICTED: uncharacterized protein LOC109356182 [Lupinus angustifolius]
MPIDEHLKARGLAMGSICFLCIDDEESSQHIFFMCRFAKAIWRGLQAQLECNLDSSSISNLLIISDSLSPLPKEVMIACILNAISTIWFCKNQARFNDTDITHTQAMAKIRADIAFIGNFSKLYAKNSRTEFNLLRAFGIKGKYIKAPTITEVLWKTPSFGLVKVNSDGAAHGNSNGDLMGCFASYFSIQNSIYVELLAAIMVVSIAHAKGWRSIWLECDSKVVVDIFQGSKLVPWRLSNLMNKCRHLLNSMQFMVSHIFIQGNVCANKLATFGVNSKIDSWWNSMPTFLYDDFYRNRNLLPNYRFRNL